MIERLIDSPIPMPLGLVVKKALNWSYPVSVDGVGLRYKVSCG